MIKVFLAVLIATNAGHIQRAVTEVPSIDRCVELGKDFISQNPADLDAKALGFVCEVQHVRDPSERPS